MPITSWAVPTGKSLCSTISAVTEDGIEGAPNLIIEILSASTAKYDKGSKRKIYSRTGAALHWCE